MIKILGKTLPFLFITLLAGCSLFPQHNICDYSVLESKQAIDGFAVVNQQELDESEALEFELRLVEFEVESDDEIPSRTIELANAILDLDPYNDYVYYQRSIAYEVLGETEKAYADLRMVTLLYPGAHQFYYDLVTLPTEADFSEIQRSLSRCLKSNPENSYYLFELGMYHFIVDELEEASEYFEKTIALDSNSYLSYFLLANIHYELGEFEIAYTHICKAIELHDKNPLYYELKAKLAGAMGNDDDENTSYKNMLDTCNHPDVCFKAFFQVNH